MKIDRLLSIIIYLLNRELVSARELAEHFEVSVRTIQRDMDTLACAGIPILSAQGPHGGFGIIESYKLDRQLVDTDDLFFILTALESISATLKNKQLSFTLEKIKTLVRDYQAKEIDRRKDELFIDFSALSIGKNRKELFYLLEEAIEKNRLVEFTYTNSRYQVSTRIVEPMTIVFKWFSWYLYGFCRLRNDYRLFRLSRMRDVALQQERFTRRSKSFADFSQRTAPEYSLVELTLKFHPSLKVMVEDYFSGAKIESKEDGFVYVQISYPEDEWLYGLILSYGDKVEVVAPQYMRHIILRKSREIAKKYQNKL